jgi:competence protein ComEC
MHLHPLLPLTVSLILGIAWQASGVFPWLAMLIFPALYIFFITNTQNSYRIAYATLLAGLFFAGGMRYAQQQKNFDTFYQATVNKQCSAIAQVSDIEESYRRPGQTIFTLTIRQLTHDKKIIPEATNTQVHASSKTEQTVRVGDIVFCKKLFFRQNFNQDYKRYLIKEHLGGHLYTKEIFTVKKRPAYSPQRWIIEKRNSIVRQLKQKLSPTTFTLFASIFWGKKQIDAIQIDPIKENFKAWGLLHYLARSGLHLIVFVLLWTWLMGFVPLPYNIKQIILLFIIFGYLAMSWSSISFSRALILFVFYRLCLLFDLQINALYLLALTCIIILLHNPYQLFFLDFQLSFGLTFALALFSSLRASNQNC